MEYPGTDRHDNKRTPYAVDCWGAHGLVYLTDSQYDWQMRRPDSLWKCPLCNGDATWEDDNYDAYIEDDDAL